MAAINFRGGNDVRDTVRNAAGSYTRGVPAIVKDVVGIPITSGVAGDTYSRHVSGIFELDAVGSDARGDTLYITAADGTISRTAGTGKRPFAKTVALAGDPGVPTGKIWADMAPYAPAATAA